MIASDANDVAASPARRAGLSRRFARLPPRRSRLKRSSRAAMLRLRVGRATNGPCWPLAASRMSCFAPSCCGRGRRARSSRAVWRESPRRRRARSVGRAACSTRAPRPPATTDPPATRRCAPCSAPLFLSPRRRSRRNLPCLTVFRSSGPKSPRLRRLRPRRISRSRPRAGPPTSPEPHSRHLRLVRPCSGKLSHAQFVSRGFGRPRPRPRRPRPATADAWNARHAGHVGNAGNARKAGNATCARRRPQV